MSRSMPAWAGLPLHQRSRLYLKRSTKCECLFWTLFKDDGTVDDRESETLMGRAFTTELRQLGVTFAWEGSEKSIVGIVSHEYRLTLPDDRVLEIILAAHFKDPPSQVLQ